MSRRWGAWLTGAAAAVLMVAVSITGNQSFTDHGLRWVWLIGALAVAGLSVTVGQRLARSQPRGILRLTGAGGRPLRLGEATLTDLGVHESRFSVEQSGYIAREKDCDLVDALQEGDRRLVIVQGPRLAGTTRTLAQAAQAILPDHRVVAFTVDQRLSMAEMVQEAAQWARDWPGAVLWLDPLSGGQLEQIDQALLDMLPDGLWVLATLHAEDSVNDRVPAYVKRVLDEYAALVTLGTLTSAERAALRAEEAYDDLAPALDNDSDVLMGCLMVALDQIRDVLTPGADEAFSNRISLLRAVTDWWRVGMPDLLTRRVLIATYEDYRREVAGLGPGAAVSRTGFNRALSWATSAASPGRPQLIDVQSVSQGVQYVPHPLLEVVADEPGTGWTVADALWAYAERNVRGRARIRIGYAALDCQAFAHARNLLESFRPDQISPSALLTIAGWLETSSDAKNARSWYAKVIATVDATAMPQAMYALGGLEGKLGNQAEARQWYVKAIQTKDPEVAPKAKNNLGTLERQQGNISEARRLWEQVIGTGHPEAAPRAMVNLALLALEQHNPREARRRWQQAIGTGHPDISPEAMYNLAVLDEQQGNYKQARRQWKQAIGTGHPDAAPRAMLALAGFENDRGNLPAARQWYGNAIDSEHPRVAAQAMYGLGLLEERQGSILEARRWYERVITTKGLEPAPKAITNLGLIEWREGNVFEARRLWKQAIGTGDAEAVSKAKIGLGVLEQQLGNTPEARRLLGEVINAGPPELTATATINLGTLERQEGNISEARRLWKQVIDTGMPAARSAEQLLGDLDRRTDEQNRAEQFTKFGWRVYADEKLISPIPSGADEDRESK